MPDKGPSVKILKVVIEHQRKFHDELTASFRGLRSKILYFIAAILAILTFLYSGAADSEKSIQERLFIPDELYGIIFYFFGLASVLYALVLLVRGARPDAQWTAPTPNTGEYDDGREEEFLQKVAKSFEDATKENQALHAKKSSAIKDAFYPLLLGAIILVVLRFFQ